MTNRKIYIYFKFHLNILKNKKVMTFLLIFYISVPSMQHVKQYSKYLCQNFWFFSSKFRHTNCHSFFILQDKRKRKTVLKSPNWDLQDIIISNLKNQLGLLNLYNLKPTSMFNQQKLNFLLHYLNGTFFLFLWGKCYFS